MYSFSVSLFVCFITFLLLLLFSFFVFIFHYYLFCSNQRNFEIVCAMYMDEYCLKNTLSHSLIHTPHTNACTAWHLPMGCFIFHWNTFSYSVISVFNAIMLHIQTDCTIYVRYLTANSFFFSRLWEKFLLLECA